MSPSARSGRGAARVGRVFSDVVLLAQLVGVGAKVLWLGGSQSDAVGFVLVGGYLAGLLAYFGFFLFGVIYLLSRSPVSFWRTLFPFNLGLSIILLFMFSFSKASPLYLMLFAAGGFLAARWAARYVFSAPFLWSFAVCGIAVLAARYGLPRAALLYAAMAAGVFFLVLPCLPLWQRRGSDEYINEDKQQ